MLSIQFVHQVLEILNDDSLVLIYGIDTGATVNTVNKSHLMLSSFDVASVVVVFDVDILQ